MKTIYVDNAATTKMSDVAVQAMIPYFQDVYANASSLHHAGQKAAADLGEMRTRFANCIGANASEIYFTSCGTESDNWALQALAKYGAKRGKKHIISSKFEHHAVLHVLESLEKEGFEVTYLDVYDDGYVRVEDLKNAIREDTSFVTIMTANNEIGTIQPIREIGEICREKKIVFHTDAVQAVGHIPLDVVRDNVDLLSVSAHKFHGPKGVGALYCRKGIPLLSFIQGGAQEKNKRAGTESLALVSGMVAALEDSIKNLSEKNKKIKAMQDKLISAILPSIERSRLNGGTHDRLAGNISFCFEGVEGEALLLFLDLEGICASSGSACTSGSLDPSHVLLSLGLPHEIAHGSLRISLCEYNTMDEINKIIEVLPKIIKRLRDMSPVWERIQKGENYVV